VRHAQVVAQLLRLLARLARQNARAVALPQLLMHGRGVPEPDVTHLRPVRLFVQHHLGGAFLAFLRRQGHAAGIKNEQAAHTAPFRHPAPQKLPAQPPRRQVIQTALRQIPVVSVGQQAQKIAIVLLLAVAGKKQHEQIAFAELALKLLERPPDGVQRRRLAQHGDFKPHVGQRPPKKRRIVDATLEGVNLGVFVDINGNQQGFATHGAQTQHPQRVSKRRGQR